jgi:DEAD/DEAH box helicase domain-containing protein
VLSGYPGTRAATVQRSGRAGRRGRPSLTVLCLSSAPLDQFVAAQPSFLFGEPPEHARVDPDNPEVLLPHLRCAAFELAFGPGRGLPGLAEDELHAGLDHLASVGGLYREEGEDGVVYAAAGAESPAEHVDLRGSIEENFSVLDEATGDVLAQVDFEDAPLYLHPGAIYGVEGRTFEVRALDWEARKARVRRTNADYYTEAVVKTRVRVIDSGDEQSQPSEGQGMAHVLRTVPGFKKIRFGTHENIGYGPVSLPDLELHTTSAYWRVPAVPLHGTPAEEAMKRAATALAASHALHHVAAMVLMCDVGDLGSVVTAGHPSAWGPAIMPGSRPSVEAIVNAQALPYLVLFDKQPGGAGLATTAFAMGGALFERVASVVSGCACERGCPTCMGPASDDAWEAERADVVAVLQALARSVPGPA